MIEIKDKAKCCGCGACKNICPKGCIEMKEDEEGFLYPHINTSLCVQCGLCEKVCPVLQREADEEKQQTAYLVRSKEERICSESTSGGAFSELATGVLKKKGVVFGAAFDEQFDVFHTYAETEEELKQFRNSKYVQSRMGDTFQKVEAYLKEGRLVLFSGTPCQVEGLYHYLGGTRENLILVDIVCHAVPSPLVWRKYKEYCAPKNGSPLKAAAFRDKSKYGYQYSQMRMEYEDGTVRYCGVESDPYLRAFFSNLSDRPSCYACPFKKRYRVSDLTIWDCFDVYRIEKQFDDNKGVTRILTHSKKGDDLVRGLTQCHVVEIDAELAVLGVKELVESVPENPKRTAFFQDCREMDAQQLCKKWFPDTAKVKIERFVRHSFEYLGIYRPAKRIVRKMLGKE